MNKKRKKKGKKTHKNIKFKRNQKCSKRMDKLDNVTKAGSLTG